MKRGLLLTVALLLVVSLLSACGQTGAPSSADKGAAASAPDAGELVNLVVYLLGDGTKDDQAVFDVLNEKTKERINTTFERKLLSWADYNTKYPLVFASGEEFDLIFTATWSFYAPQAVKGGFLELTDDLLTDYAPNIKENLPEIAWKQARIDGKIYMVPNTQKEYNHLGILVRGDLRKKYDIPEITSLDILEQYWDAIAQNESGILPMDGGSEFDKWVLRSLFFNQPHGLAGISEAPGYVYKLTDPSGTLVKESELPEFEAFMDRMVDYNARGFWSRNALNQQNRLDDNFKNGTSATALHNVSTMIGAWREANKNHPEWEAEIYDSMFGEYPTIVNSYLGNGMAVHAASKNPERSLMWLDTVRFDQACYDLMMSGIEGTHWIDEGEGLSSPGPVTDGYGGFSNWGFTTEQMKRESTAQWPGFADLQASYDERAVDCPPYYFLFDDAEVKNEVAAMTNLSLQYGKTFDFGFEKDWRAAYADVDKQYDAAGREKIKELWEKQLVDFLASYNAK